VIGAVTAAPMLSPKQRRSYERLGITEFLHVKLA
jgi:hypothetical protein